MSPEVTITRSEVLIVDKVEPKTFQGETQGIHVFCKDGAKHLVNLKHKDLWQVFQPGRAVEVGYGEYMNKEFIHTAKLVAAPPPTKPLPPPTMAEKSPESQKPPSALETAVKALNSGDSKQTINRDGSIEGQVAAKIGSELMVAKIITPDSDFGKATIEWALSKLKLSLW